MRNMDIIPRTCRRSRCPSPWRNPIMTPAWPVWPRRLARPVTMSSLRDAPAITATSLTPPRASSVQRTATANGLSLSILCSMAATAAILIPRLMPGSIVSTCRRMCPISSGSWGATRSLWQSSTSSSRSRAVRPRKMAMPVASSASMRMATSPATTALTSTTMPASPGRRSTT